jgi:hypothetical protein
MHVLMVRLSGAVIAMQGMAVSHDRLLQLENRRAGGFPCVG